MSRKAILIFFMLLSSSIIRAQDENKYFELVKEAEQAYDKKDFLKSGQKYAAAFEAFGGKGIVLHRYNAACSWSLAHQSDSAFAQLFRIAEKANYNELFELLTDPDLNNLHTDKRWEKLVALVRANKEKDEVNFDRALVAMLDTIHLEDQKYRRELRGIEAKYGRRSKELKAQWKIINEKDSVNLVKVKKILDEKGWLGPDLVGEQGSKTLFLVIQHADLATQEKYLPLMRAAVKDGRAKGSYLALLEDRIALQTGKDQIYGSQIGQDEATGAPYVLPLTDPDNVDKRRAAVGLGPLQEYVSFWGMTWDAAEYKKKLPGYREKNKK